MVARCRHPECEWSSENCELDDREAAYRHSRDTGHICEVILEAKIKEITLVFPDQVPSEKEGACE